MPRVELIFWGRGTRVPLTAIEVPRVPCVGEEVEFADDYPNEELAGCSFNVKQVGFQVAAPDTQSIPLLVVEE